MAHLTQEELKEHVWYDPIVGVFIRKKDRGRNNPAGRFATSRDRHGYIKVWISDRSYKAHRLAWLYFYGYFPEGHIDHKNRITSDNRISNLRECTVAQNMANARCKKTNKSGVKGVSITKFGKFHAAIKMNGKKVYLGSYPTAEEASDVYMEKLRELYGDFASN